MVQGSTNCRQLWSRYGSNRVKSIYLGYISSSGNRTVVIMLYGNILVTVVCHYNIFFCIVFGFVILWVLYIQNLCTDINRVVRMYLSKKNWG